MYARYIAANHSDLGGILLLLLNIRQNQSANTNNAFVLISPCIARHAVQHSCLTRFGFLNI